MQIPDCCLKKVKVEKWNLSIEGEETEKISCEYKFQPQTLPHQTSTYIKQSNETHLFAASKWVISKVIINQSYNGFMTQKFCDN